MALAPLDRDGAGRPQHEPSSQKPTVESIMIRFSTHGEHGQCDGCLVVGTLAGRFEFAISTAALTPPTIPSATRRASIPPATRGIATAIESRYCSWLCVVFVVGIGG